MFSFINNQTGLCSFLFVPVMYFYTVCEVVVVTDRVYEAVVAVLLSVQHAVLDED